MIWYMVGVIRQLVIDGIDGFFDQLGANAGKIVGDVFEGSGPKQRS